MCLATWTSASTYFAMIRYWPRIPNKNSLITVSPFIGQDASCSSTEGQKKGSNFHAQCRDHSRKISIGGDPRKKKKKRKRQPNTYYQMCFSWNMLVRLLRQLLRDHRAHCFRNLGLSSRVVWTSASGWYCMNVSQPWETIQRVMKLSSSAFSWYLPNHHSSLVKA